MIGEKSVNGLMSISSSFRKVSLCTFPSQQNSQLQSVEHVYTTIYSFDSHPTPIMSSPEFDYEKDLRDTALNPTAAHVEQEARFEINAPAQVALDNPSIKNIESHLKYQENPRFHIRTDKQPIPGAYYQDVAEPRSNLHLPPPLMFVRQPLLILPSMLVLQIRIGMPESRQILCAPLTPRRILMS